MGGNAMIILTFLILASAQHPEGGYVVPDWELSQGSTSYPPIVTPMRDMNGDGHDDWLLDGNDTGYVTLRSGRDGSILWQLFPEASYQSMQVVDLEQDGRDELLYSVSSPSQFVRCVDAETGALLWEMVPTASPTARAKLIHCEDLNGDGVLEVLATDWSPNLTGRAVVTAIDANGTELWSGRPAIGNGGESSFAFHDLDGDGVSEVLVGDGTYSGTYSEQGRIRVADAFTGALRWDALGQSAYSRLGAELMTHDLNSDGQDELLSISSSATAAGMLEAGEVVVFDAFGAIQWSLIGEQPGHALGRELALGDGNQDGWVDLFLGSESFNSKDGLVQAIDGRTGLEQWRAQDWPDAGKSFGGTVHFSAGTVGGPGFLVIGAVEHKSAGFAQKLAGVEFRNPSNGNLVRRELIQSGVNGGEITVHDADHDGEPEAYLRFPQANQAHARLNVVTPSRGILWSATEPLAGKQMVVIEATASRPALVVFSQNTARNGIPAAGEVRCFRMLDGREVWHHSGSLEGGQFGIHFELIDLGASSPQLLRVDPSRVDTDHTRLYRIDRGELVAAFKAAESSLLGYSWLSLTPSVDSDGDGRREWLVVTLRDSMRQFSMGANRLEFLSASQSTISRATGGEVTLELDFTKQSAWWEYRVLLSGHGVGESVLDGQILVPLRRDRYFAISERGELPTGAIPKSTGSLDKNGRQSVKVRFSSKQIPIGMIGRSIHFAVAAREPWGEWDLCSVPVELRFTP